MIRKTDERCYQIRNSKKLTVGEVVPYLDAWVFYPSYDRWAIDLKTAGEILTLLEELNQ